MDTNTALTVQVQRSGDKYTWGLHRDGHFHPVKFSVPLYVSEGRGPSRRKRNAHGSFGPIGTYCSSAVENEMIPTS